MTEERMRMAKKFRAEGEEKAMIIMAEADKEKTKLLSESRKKADEILGEAEAEANSIYTKAYAKNPEFFSFLRTLEAYEKFMDEKTTVVLSRDSELLKLLTKGK
jgi:membrane protease subunit HflC